MTSRAYLSAARSVLDHLERTQLPAIDAAAERIAKALPGGGALFCAEIGHGGQGDFIHRAGGLVAIQHFTFSLTINDAVPTPLRKRPAPGPFDREIETVRLAVGASNLRAGDVLFVSSVSGRNVRPVELALASRSRGVCVVGFTSLAYTQNIEPLHPSGKRLRDAVDIVIDCGAPFGDAAVDIPGYADKLLPVSGVGMGVAGHMIIGAALEKMAAAGTPASVFISHNRPGGSEQNERSRQLCEQRGF